MEVSIENKVEVELEESVVLISHDGDGTMRSPGKWVLESHILHRPTQRKPLSAFITDYRLVHCISCSSDFDSPSRRFIEPPQQREIQ